MDPYFHIHRPTIILNEERVRINIQKMVEKATANRVQLRPHFKTHQSAAIGEWFREEGISAITVSSLSMAAYFAKQGWEDITVAFPFNLREIEDLWNLGERSHLELLVESDEVVEFLDARYGRELDLWIKIEAGGNRAGIQWQDSDAVTSLAERIAGSSHLKFKGILSHFGQTYHVASRNEAAQLYSEGVDRMRKVRAALRKAGFRKTQISVGDTPGCCSSDDLGGVDEIRPGNFIFFDITQLRIGSCSEEEIALAVACPVVSKHPERNELILYGGAVHLSKEHLVDGGVHSYGDVAFPAIDGWSEKIPGGYIRSLSQEHGVVHLPGDAMSRIKVGDLLMVLPVHSCLTVAALGEYITLEGERIETMVTRSGDQVEGHGGEGEQEQDNAQYTDHLPTFG
jgi:D-serine deaminase-like pyridoxal phosphate-dependent protein